MIKVLIADNHQLIREGLKMIMREDSEIRIVGEAHNGEETLDKIQNRDCDILLMHLNMPGTNGIELIMEVKKLKPNVQILVLSMQPEDKFALRTLRAGASGYLCKDKALENLLIAIRRLHTRGRYLSEAMIDKLAYEIIPTTAVLPHRQLSSRELQTMFMLASGKKVKEIADELTLSISTVFTYRVRIFEKLNIKNIVELTHYAISNDLIEVKS